MGFLPAAIVPGCNLLNTRARGLVEAGSVEPGLRIYAAASEFGFAPVGCSGSARPATGRLGPCPGVVSDRSFILLVVLGMLVAAVAVTAPVRELDPAATVHRLAAESVAESERSLWATWAATPRATLHFPRVANPEQDWLGPVRTPRTQAPAPVQLSAP